MKNHRCFCKKFIILVGDDKIVSKLGSRGKLPVEVVPFGAALVKHKLHSLGIHGEIWMKNGTQGITDNGNLILDCIIPQLLILLNLNIPSGLSRALSILDFYSNG